MNTLPIYVLHIVHRSSAKVRFFLIFREHWKTLNFQKLRKISTVSALEYLGMRHAFAERIGIIVCMYLYIHTIIRRIYNYPGSPESWNQKYPHQKPEMSADLPHSFSGVAIFCIHKKTSNLKRSTSSPKWPIIGKCFQAWKRWRKSL